MPNLALEFAEGRLQLPAIVDIDGVQHVLYDYTMGDFKAIALYPDKPIYTTV